MRATAVLDNLLEKSSILTNIVSARPSLPVLSGVLIKAGNGKLTLSATDLEIGVITEVPASVDEEGSAVIPAAPFLETVSSLKEEKITIEKKDNTVTISGKRARASFVTMDEAEFPNLFEEKGENIITLKKEAAEKEMGRVVFASSQEAGRPALSAIMLKQDKEGFLMVATDSHRLSLNKTSAVKTKKAVSKKPILIPAKIIKLIISQKTNEDVEVFLVEKNNQATFTFGGTTLVGRLIDAEYPDFEKIMPDGFSAKAEFEKGDFLSALKTASIFARDNANIIRLSLSKSGIRVSAKSQSMGENTTDVDAKVTGEDNEIAFNGRYLLEFLQNISEDQIVFEMQGPLNPGVFKIAGNPNFIHLIMPIRISEE